MNAEITKFLNESFKTCVFCMEVNGRANKGFVYEMMFNIINGLYNRGDITFFERGRILGSLDMWYDDY